MPPYLKIRNHPQKKEDGFTSTFQKAFLWRSLSGLLQAHNSIVHLRDEQLIHTEILRSKRNSWEEVQQDKQRSSCDTFGGSYNTHFVRPEIPDPGAIEANGARHVHVLQNELLLPH